MSKLIETSVDHQDVVEDPEHVAEAVSQPPVVISVQEVAFSTAAAVPLRAETHPQTVIAYLRAMFRTSPDTAEGLATG